MANEAKPAYWDFCGDLMCLECLQKTEPDEINGGYPIETDSLPYCECGALLDLHYIGDEQEANSG